MSGHSHDSYIALQRHVAYDLSYITCYTRHLAYDLSYITYSLPYSNQFPRTSFPLRSGNPHMKHTACRPPTHVSNCRRNSHTVRLSYCACVGAYAYACWDALRALHLTYFYCCSGMRSAPCILPTLPTLPTIPCVLRERPLPFHGITACLLTS